MQQQIKLNNDISKKKSLPILSPAAYNRNKGRKFSYPGLITKNESNYYYYQKSSMNPKNDSNYYPQQKATLNNYNNNYNNNNNKNNNKQTLPSSDQVEKLQKKLIKTLEAQFEINKKYENANYSPKSSKPYTSEAEQKRSQALALLRKRTQNTINANTNTNTNDETTLAKESCNQRQQAISVLMKRLNVNGKEGDTHGATTNSNNNTSSNNGSINNNNNSNSNDYNGREAYIFNPDYLINSNYGLGDNSLNYSNGLNSQGNGQYNNNNNNGATMNGQGKGFNSNNTINGNGNKALNNTNGNGTSPNNMTSSFLFQKRKSISRNQQRNLNISTDSGRLSPLLGGMNYNSRPKSAFIQSLNKNMKSEVVADGKDDSHTINTGALPYPFYEKPLKYKFYQNRRSSFCEGYLDNVANKKYSLPNDVDLAKLNPKLAINHGYIHSGNNNIKMFENNQLIFNQNDPPFTNNKNTNIITPKMFENNMFLGGKSSSSAPSSPTSNPIYLDNSSRFMGGETSSSTATATMTTTTTTTPLFTSTEKELNQKIAENKMMIEYLSKICNGQASMKELLEFNQLLYNNNMTLTDDFTNSQGVFTPLTSTTTPTSTFLGNNNNNVASPGFRPASPFFNNSNGAMPQPPPSSPFMNGNNNSSNNNNGSMTPSSPYLGQNQPDRNNMTPSSPYLGQSQPNRNNMTPSSPYLGQSQPNRNNMTPSSPFMGSNSKRNSIIPSSPYMGSNANSNVNNNISNGVMRPSSPYMGNSNGTMRPSSPYMGNSNGAMRPSSPYMSNSNGNSNGAMHPSSPYMGNSNGNSNGAMRPSSPYMSNSNGNRNSMGPSSPYMGMNNAKRNSMTPSSPYLENSNINTTNSNNNNNNYPMNSNSSNANRNGMNPSSPFMGIGNRVASPKPSLSTISANSSPSLTSSFLGGNSTMNTTNVVPSPQLMPSGLANVGNTNLNGNRPMNNSTLIEEENDNTNDWATIISDDSNLESEQGTILSPNFTSANSTNTNNSNNNTNSPFFFSSLVKNMYTPTRRRSFDDKNDPNFRSSNIMAWKLNSCGMPLRPLNRNMLPLAYQKAFGPEFSSETSSFFSTNELNMNSRISSRQYYQSVIPSYSKNNFVQQPPLSPNLGPIGSPRTISPAKVVEMEGSKLKDSNSKNGSSPSSTTTMTTACSPNFGFSFVTPSEVKKSNQGTTTTTTITTSTTNNYPNSPPKTPLPKSGIHDNGCDDDKNDGNHSCSSDSSSSSTSNHTRFVENEEGEVEGEERKIYYSALKGNANEDFVQFSTFKDILDDKNFLKLNSTTNETNNKNNTFLKHSLSNTSSSENFINNHLSNSFIPKAKNEEGNDYSFITDISQGIYT